jgi:hypothetical protein
MRVYQSQIYTVVSEKKCIFVGAKKNVNPHYESYCHFLTIRGIPVFVDSVEQWNQEFNKYLSLCIYVLIIAGDSRFFLYPRKCIFFLKPQYIFAIYTLSSLIKKFICDIFRKRKYKLPSSNQSILCMCTLRRIRIEINHGSQNVFWVLTISPSGSKLKCFQWLLVPITTIMRVTVTFLLFEVYQFLWIVLNNEIKNSINIWSQNVFWVLTWIGGY